MVQDPSPLQLKEQRHKQYVEKIRVLSKQLDELKKQQRQLDPAAGGENATTKLCDSILHQSINRVITKLECEAVCLPAQKSPIQLPGTVIVRFAEHQCHVSTHQRSLRPHSTSDAMHLHRPRPKSLRELRDEACRFWGLHPPKRFFVSVNVSSLQRGSNESLWSLNATIEDVMQRYTSAPPASMESSVTFDLCEATGASDTSGARSEAKIQPEHITVQDQCSVRGHDAQASLRFLSQSKFRKRLWMGTYGLLLTLIAVVTMSLQVSIYRDYDPATIVAQAYVDLASSLCFLTNEGEIIPSIVLWLCVRVGMRTPSRLRSLRPLTQIVRLTALKTF